MEQSELLELIARSRAGDRQAQERLICAAQDRVYYHCRKMLRNESDALDATQDVLLAMLNGLHALREPAAFWGWLNQMTGNICCKKLSRTRRILQWQLPAGRGDWIDTDEQHIPDQALDTQETQRLITQLVDGLPETQRLCVLMHYYDEMSVHEIAQATGVSEGTVKSRLYYARKTIKRAAERYAAQGTPLYGVSPLPFLSYFLHQEAAGYVLSAAAAHTVRQAVLGAAAAGGSAAAGSLLFGALTSRSAAILVGAALAAAVAGGAVLSRTGAPGAPPAQPPAAVEQVRPEDPPAPPSRQPVQPTAPQQVARPEPEPGTLAAAGPAQRDNGTSREEAPPSAVKAPEPAPVGTPEPEDPPHWEFDPTPPVPWTDIGGAVPVWTEFDPIPPAPPEPSQPSYQDEPENRPEPRPEEPGPGPEEPGPGPEEPGPETPSPEPEEPGPETPGQDPVVISKELVNYGYAAGYGFTSSFSEEWGGDLPAPLTYTSSDSSVVQIASSGKFTTLAPGTATLIAVDPAQPERTYSLSVTVEDTFDWSYNMHHASLSLKVGEVCTEGIATYGHLTDNDIQAIEWTSSDPSVAAAEPMPTPLSCQVRAAAPGTATVTGTISFLVDTCAGEAVMTDTVSFLVSVEEGPKPIRSNAKIRMDGRLNDAPLPRDRYLIRTVAEGEEYIRFVGDCYMGVAPGTAKVLYYAGESPDGPLTLVMEQYITVIPMPEPSVTEQTYRAPRGFTGQFGAIWKDPLPSDVRYTTSNSSVAAIDFWGNFTALSAGEVLLTAARPSEPDVLYVLHLQVEEKFNWDYLLDMESVTLTVGQQSRAGLDGYSYPVSSCSQPTFSWTVSDPMTAEIIPAADPSVFQVKGLSPGTTGITGTVTFTVNTVTGPRTMTDTITIPVTVLAPAPEESGGDPSQGTDAPPQGTEAGTGSSSGEQDEGA